MNPSEAVHVEGLTRLSPDAEPMERKVTQWLADGTPLLWVPILDIENYPEGLEAARELSREFDGGWLILNKADFLRLPEGIKGWLMPIFHNDTDVACGRWQQEIYFIRIQERGTGAVVTYQSDVGGEPPAQ